MKQLRESFFSFIFLVIVISSFVSVTLRAQSNNSSTEQISQQADVIVVGKVGHLESEWNADKSRIQTRVTITVNDVVKGDAATQSVVVYTPGGEVDGVGEWYSHNAKFVNDEEVVVFAKKDNRGLLRVASGQNGKFTIAKDAATGRKFIPNVGTLEAFTSHIKNVLKAHQGDPKQK
ncbi:MAG TPA: hypothetical protein VKI62_07340 [Bacteroidota bacterium]|nr:hypothetical protein [Bacteroidota bacterium]